MSVQVSGTLCANQDAATVAACVGGAGFGRFLSYQVQPWIDRGDLAAVLPAYESASIPVSLVCPHARFVHSRVRVLVFHVIDPLGRISPRSGWQCKGLGGRVIRGRRRTSWVCLQNRLCVWWNWERKIYSGLSFRRSVGVLVMRSAVFVQRM